MQENDQLKLKQHHIVYAVNVIKFHTEISDKMAYANSADPDQKEQSDQGLHCLPYSTTYFKN